MKHPRRRGLIMAMAGWLIGTSGLTSAAPSDKPPHVSLLELYTSEGCSSCPPTDRWVSELPRPQLVPEKLVVLAFHVDYWNYIGWPDRFSQRKFTERQQQLVRVTGLRTAYTPQLVLNGRDYRRYGSIEPEVTKLHAQPANARVALRVTKKASAIHVTATAELLRAETGATHLVIAAYENNLETEVKAGENSGRRLRHDYVVRVLLEPVTFSGGKARWEGDIPVAKDWKIGDLGVAAFVQVERNGEILQAASQPVR